MPRTGTTRRPHQLKPAASTTTYRELLFVDTETRATTDADGSQLHKLELGSACYVRRRSGARSDTLNWHDFDTREGFFHLIERYARSHGRLVVVAHNWSFDLPVLHGFEHLIRAGWTVTKVHDRRPTFIMRCERDGATLLLLDNGNFFPGKLEDLGASVGIDKIAVDFRRVSRAKLAARCRRDVEIMVEAWRRFLDLCDEEDLGPAATTRSAHAMNAYRHRFMEHPILIHTNRQALELERAGYYGGRCECFRVGDVPGGPVTVLDVDSMYPAVMRDAVYPTKLLAVGAGRAAPNLRDALGRHLVIADVTLETDAPIYPLRTPGGLTFPVGRFQTTLCTPELQEAAARGHLVSYRAAAVYEGAPIFRPFVNYFHARKLEAEAAGDAMGRKCYKVTLVSLYGKFGQRSGYWRVVGECDPNEVGSWGEYVGTNPRPILWRKVAGTVQRLEAGRESFDSFPAIAAHVTSYGRVSLWHMIEAAGLEDVAYVDTDALFVTPPALARLEPFTAIQGLGALTVRAVAKSARIFAPKHYELDGELVLKGIRRDAEEIAPGAYRQELWPGFASQIAGGSVTDYRVRTQVRRVNFRYLKGVVLGDGRTRPFELPREAALLPGARATVAPSLRVSEPSSPPKSRESS